MTVRITKARHFAFLLYPESIPDNWQELLESLAVSIAISPLHDLDKKEDDALTDDEKLIVLKGGIVYKKPHYHVIYIARNPVSVESVRKKIKRKLGNVSITHIEIIDDIKGTYEYLTHESKSAKAKNKHVYDKKDVVHLNDFDIDRYITLDQSEKKELKSKLLRIVSENHLVNVIDLLNFLKSHGEQYGISNMNDVTEIISTNSGAFRLWFEGNYQCGYRARYVKTINSETGEITEEENIEFQEENEK